jgi:hypothetical protein
MQLCLVWASVVHYILSKNGECSGPPVLIAPYIVPLSALILVGTVRIDDSVRLQKKLEVRQD